MNNEALDAGVGKLGESSLEPQLGVWFADCAVVDVTSDEQKIDLLCETQVDQIFERLVSRLLHTPPDNVVARLQANDRAVEVKICGVNEFEWLQWQITSRNQGRPGF